MNGLTATRRSSTSLKSVKLYNKDEKVLDFVEYVDIACRKFNVPGKLIVNKELQNDEFLRYLKNDSKILRKPVKSVPVLGKKESFTLLADPDNVPIISIPDLNQEILTISAVYDAQNKLVEILINEEKAVPRILMQIIGLIMPRYPFLTRIAIKKCRINQYIIYEMSKFLDFTSVTDVCLDGSTFPEANFALLLQNTRVSSLSLSRCDINDVVCETIASQLHYTSVQCYLTTLNLSTNRITDEGARCLGLALRSNRYLRYLNLAANCITDEGANHILKPLMYFPLTLEEINAELVLYGEYLKDKCVKLRNESTKPKDDSAILIKESKSKDESAFKLKKRKIDPKSSLAVKNKVKNIPSTIRGKDKLYSSTTDVAGLSTESLCFASVGPFAHPFSKNNVKIIDGFKYCKGNMVLCYLNLSYNNISYITLKKLNEVLKHQSNVKSSSDYGLIKVVIEGNDLPNREGCTEIDCLNDYLKRALLNMLAKNKHDAKNKTKNKSYRSDSLYSLNKYSC